MKRKSSVKISSVKLKLFILATTALCSFACADNERPDPHDQPLLRAEMWKMENPNCAVKGNSANWQAAYCMWMNKTNEYDTDDVKACYDALTERQGIPRNLCERNQYFKKEICKTLVMDKTFPGSLSDCLASDDSIPRVVREGLQ